MVRDGLRRARKDVSHFAEALLGRPLWRHQREVVESDARHRVICSGRQAGKSTTLAVSALHTAFTKPGLFVLIISAGEQAARDLLGNESVVVGACARVHARVAHAYRDQSRVGRSKAFDDCPEPGPAPSSLR